MPTDSFGYTVMTLREVIEGLQELGDRLPQLMDQPVWIGGQAPLYQPVKLVQRGQYGAMLVVETGGYS